MEAEHKGGQKNMTRAILMLSVIVFAVGFGMGFYVFGYHKKTSADYKQSLREVIGYIDSLEKERKELSERIGAFEAQRDLLKKGAGDDTIQTVELRQRLETLERENATLRSAMSQNQTLLQENYQLRERVQALEGGMDPHRAAAAPQQPQPAMPQTNTSPR